MAIHVTVIDYEEYSYSLSVISCCSMCSKITEGNAKQSNCTEYNQNIYSVGRLMCTANILTTPYSFWMCCISHCQFALNNILSNRTINIRNHTRVYEHTLHEWEINCPNKDESFEIIGETVGYAKALDKHIFLWPIWIVVWPFCYLISINSMHA